MTVDDLYHPYIRPQENGNRSDVRWLFITNQEGSGIKFQGNPIFNFSAFHYLNEDFDPGESKAQHHAAHLKKRDLVNLNIDYGQMGVGGDTSWGAHTHPQYCLTIKEYHFSFIILPIENLNQYNSRSLLK